MTRNPLIFILQLVLFSLLLPACKSKGTGTVRLNLATFNIRYETSEADPQNNWTNRKSRIKTIVEDNAFDVFGINEMRFNQYNDMQTMLSGYSFHAVGRDKGTNESDCGEMVGIACKKDRFSLSDTGFFWLSETPDVVGKGWDARHNRIAVYAKVTEKTSGISFWLFATHFDHVGETARFESAKLIVEKAKELNTANIPCFLVGDFNPASPSENSLMELRKHFADAYFSTPSNKRVGAFGTFNDFDLDRDMNFAPRYDYLFLFGNYVIARYTNIMDKIDGYYPSDHTPIMIYLSIVKK